MSGGATTCPKCKAPLTLEAGSIAGVTCARCNTWVALESDCSGVCNSCHKHDEHKVQSCESAEVVVGQGSSHCAASETDKSAKWQWKRLFKRIFAVR